MPDWLLILLCLLLVVAASILVMAYEDVKQKHTENTMRKMLDERFGPPEETQDD